MAALIKTHCPHCGRDLCGPPNRPIRPVIGRSRALAIYEEETAIDRGGLQLGKQDGLRHRMNVFVSRKFGKWFLGLSPGWAATVILAFVLVPGTLLTFLLNWLGWSG